VSQPAGVRASRIGTFGAASRSFDIEIDDARERGRGIGMAMAEEEIRVRVRRTMLRI
jgi:hypothetical protein